MRLLSYVSVALFVTLVTVGMTGVSSRPAKEAPRPSSMLS
jgi:hypothetical protein